MHHTHRRAPYSSQQCVCVKVNGQGAGGGEGMQQLSSRDCDKWLSMTLTMKERFFPPRGGRKGEKLPDERVASASSGAYRLGKRRVETQSTFLVNQKRHSLFSSFSPLILKFSHCCK